MVILIRNFFYFLLISFVVNFNVFADVTPMTNAIVEKIEWHATPAIQNRYKYYFENLVGHTWDPVLMKIKIDQIGKEIFQSGYLTVTTKTQIKGKPDKIIISVSINVGERTAFEFRGNTIFTRQEIQSKLVERIKNDFGKTDQKMMSGFIAEEYETAGYFNTIVKGTFLIGRTKEGTRVKNYFFNITEGEKIPVNKITLRGGYHISHDELMEILKKNGSGLASNMFYDKAFFDNFTDIIKREYLRRGYPFAEVSLPRIISQDEEDGMDLEYSVNEKQQVILSKISMTQVPLEDQVKIKELLANHENKPINIIEMEKDLKRVVGFLQAQGYYFATITNLNANNLIIYDKTQTQAELNIELATDRKVCFNDTIVNGNIKTKSEVIYREVNFPQGEIITSERLDEIKHKITGLGLFSSIKVSPYMLFDGNTSNCAKTNLVIQVKEKDFGLVELAPGYRTDLGKKLSVNSTYNNFMGMNRSLSLKTQVNRRDNLLGFDEGRKLENHRMWEYSIKTSYIEPYVFYDFFKKQLEFEFSLSDQRKRFYGFDADIFRLSPQFSRNFTKYFSSSIKWQFEKINQFDATLAKDNDNFSIGGITLTSALDFRDDPINTRRGPYFNLSAELANPYLGSMKSKELEVNFIKVISRNKYYYPINDFTLAFSLATGMEKNLANNGYIPSIKVFRLDGYDEIRGFDDAEINHLISGEAIGDVIIKNTAFFTAFKFEPRYNITDNIQVDLFFDAGRVSVNSYLPFNLRTSAGLGFKFLTAVGALDFSYGVKLHKKTYNGGVNDSVGRFHLSIGYF